MSKGASLDDLARSWGIAPADVVTFGDMPNDIEMLTLSGTSYAMSGGHPDAVSAADFVAPPASDDGVAQVLEHMLRRREARRVLSLRPSTSRLIGPSHEKPPKTSPIT